MLESVRIENFRCLKLVKVPLRPLTVLIGPNDSGKSVFLEAVSHFANRQGFAPSDHWEFNPSNQITLRGRVRGDDIQMQGTAGGSPGFKGDEQLFASIAPATVFQLPSTGVQMECSGFGEVEENNLLLSSTGDNVAALFDFFLRKDRGRFLAIITQLRALIPGFQDLNVTTPSPAQRRVDLVIENGLPIPASSASVGVRLILFFVALAWHPQPPKTILIEEPENGVHPKRLGDVMELLDNITQGKHGNHAAQVILSTHSPYLLDYVDAARHQVLVFRRNDDGSRTAEPLDQERLKSFLDEFTPGEIWMNEGETGLVGR